MEGLLSWFVCLCPMTRLPHQARGSRQVPSRLRRRASNVLRFSNASGDAPRLGAGRREDSRGNGIQLPSAKLIDGGTYRSHGRGTKNRETRDRQDDRGRRRRCVQATRRSRCNSTHGSEDAEHPHRHGIDTPESVLLRAESDPLRSDDTSPSGGYTHTRTRTQTGGQIRAEEGHAPRRTHASR